MGRLPVLLIITNEDITYRKCDEVSMIGWVINDGMSYQ